jgi:hypothetical protein
VRDDNLILCPRVSNMTNGRFEVNVIDESADPRSGLHIIHAVIKIRPVLTALGLRRSWRHEPNGVKLWLDLLPRTRTLIAKLTFIDQQRTNLSHPMWPPGPLFRTGSGTFPFPQVPLNLTWLAGAAILARAMPRQFPMVSSALSPTFAAFLPHLSVKLPWNCLD